jgi:hypothetical protein
MNDPDVKDHEWLLARERGEDISYVPASERAVYERLGALLGSGIPPRAGFRQRVLDAIDAAERAERPAEPALSVAEPGAEPGAETGAEPGAEPAPSVAKPGAKPGAETAPDGAEPGAEPDADAGAEPGAEPDAEIVPLSPLVTAERKPAHPAGGAAGAAEVIPIHRKEPRRRRWLAALGLTAVAAAAAAVFLVISSPRGADTGPVVALESKLLEGPTVLRGSGDRANQASIGQTLVIRARVQGGPAEVRVYGGSNDRLIASCKHPGECAVASDGEHRWLVLEVTLQAPGNVHTVVFVGEHIPASAGALDPDIEAAQAAKVPHKLDKKSWTVL